MRTLLFIGCFLFISTSVKAQGQALYSLFDICNGYYNPALTAHDGNSSIFVLGSHVYMRPFFLQFPQPGNMGTYGLNRSTSGASAPIFISGNQKFGIGIIHSQQSHYYEEMKDLRFNLSFQQKTGRGKLMIGINLDRISYRLDFGPKGLRHWSHPTYKANWITHTGGVGVAYHSNPNNFHLGIAYNYLSRSKLLIADDGAFYELSKELFINSCIDIKVSRRIKFKPSILINSNTIITFMANAPLEFNERLIAGLTYSTQDLTYRQTKDMYGIRFGYRFGPININYGYSNSPSRLILISSGENTVCLSYTLARKTPFKPYDFDRILPARGEE